MIVDALHRLAVAGFAIRDYQYTGFGSIYFIDFILLHRFVGITQMLSVEASKKIKRRVEFNRPFGLIDLDMRWMSDVLPGLSPDRGHILWLDYDDILSTRLLEDVVLAGTYLTRGSLLLVTVDVEPPMKDGSPKDWREYFEEEAAEWIGRGRPDTEFRLSELPRRNQDAIRAAISAGLAGRKDVEFRPLFRFLYADGHRMLTVGGMIAGRSEDAKIAASGLAGSKHIRTDWKSAPYEIVVPRVTRKERLHLDARMPSAKGWKPKEFEMAAADVRAYRDVYQFLPSYAELLL